MYKVGIITASDKGATGQRIDISGPAIEQILEKYPQFQIEKYLLVPDDEELLKDSMIDMADNLGISLILTTGGTGFSHRDVTPEATLAVIEKNVPGIPEAMRAFSLQFTSHAMLSRAASGIRGNTLIVNMPGSPKAIAETLDYILPAIEHGLGILHGSIKDCARK